MFPPETRVLIVDDSSTSREMLKKAMIGLSFKDLSYAADGHIAVEMIGKALSDQKPFELIIADIRMPNMDGLELLNFVRKTCLPVDLPFLMVTAEGDNQTVLQAIHSGVSGYLRKPFNAKMIETSLEKIWQARLKTV